MVDKKSLRILLTNDDGIHAPGLECLEKIANELSDDIWVAAPDSEQSGASHSLTLSDPLRSRTVSARKFAVRGTPTDCVILAVRHLVTGKPPDLVLSGVNRGHNIADDVTYSGTIAGAMEGTVLGIPSIALSQTYGFDERNHVKWDTAAHFSPKIIRRFIESGWPSDVLLNVNFPDETIEDVKGLKITVQGKRDQNLLRIDKRPDPRGDPYYWLMYERGRSIPGKGTDLSAIESGHISITPLHLDMTHIAAIDNLSKAMAGWNGD